MSKIDYDLKKIKGVVFDVDGVLSPSTVPVEPSGRPQRMGNVKDGYAMQLAVKYGLKIAVISGGRSENFLNRMRLLGIEDVWFGVADKFPVLKDWMKQHDLYEEEVAYMGDDIPDLKCMRHVGLPCSPYDAAWEVRQESRYVSPFTGGYGAARDLLEQIMRAKNFWDSKSVKALIW